MAYTGINKAQFEAQKFNIEADARRNTVSTIANTTLSVGQTLIQNSMQDKLEELNNKAEVYLSEKEAEIYADTDPEEWEERINTLYAEYGESVTAESKMWPTVKKQFKKGLETRKSRKISAWNAQKKQDEVAATQAHNTNQLKGIVQSQDVVKFLQSGGIIYEKGYTGKQVEEEPTLSDGFVSAGYSRIGSGETEDEGESMVFSREIQEAYNNGASRFDLSVMAIEYYAKKLHPFNEKLRQDTINKYTNELRETMPNNDLTILFNETFSDKNVNNWDFAGFMKSYKAGLDNDTYGGEPLSEAKKNELIEQAGNMWDSLQKQKSREASDFYENNIMGQIMEMKAAQAINSNQLYTTDDINNLYTKVLENNPVHAKFLTRQKEADLALARNNERIIQQRRYKTLYLSNSERTKEENEEFLNLSKTFSEDEIVTLKQQALIQAGNVQAMRDYEKSGIGYQNQANLFDEALKEVQSIEFGGTAELDKYIERYKGVLTRDQIASLRQSGDSAMNRRNTHKTEAVDKINKDLTQAILDGSTLSKAYGKMLLEKHGVTDPTVEASVYKAIEMKNQEKVVNSFYDQFMSGKLTDESLAQMIEDNEIEDNKFVFGLKEMMNNQSLKDANDKVYELINSGSFTEESLKTVLEDFSITDENVKYTFNTMLENSKLTNFQNKIGALDTEGNLDINTLKAAISENKIDENKNAAFLNPYYQRAKQLSVEKANNELHTKLYRGTLSNASLSEVGDKFGLTVEENPEFFNSWKNQIENVKIENAMKMYNSLNFDNRITVEQVDSIAEMFGLTTEDKLYKDMKTVAEQNWQKHLDTLGGTSAGFGEKTTEAGIKTVGGAIADYMNGKISRSDALAILAEQRGNFTEADYKEKYNQIGNEYMMKKNASDAIFEDVIYKPFLKDGATIMPGDTDKRMVAAGIDPADYADDADYLRMRDAEVINQHIAYVDQYTDAQMYLALREYGFSSMDIKDLGFDVPDISFQHTIEWAMEHEGEKPLTQDQYATQLASEASSKMIQGSLPSGRSFGDTSSVSGLSKSIEKSAEDVYKSVLERAKGGARYDDPDTISIFNVKKYTLDDKEYDALAFEMLTKGRITEDTYLKLIKEDISVYKTPEHQQVRDVIDTYREYITEQTGFGLDKDGKKVPTSSFLKDSVAEHFEAAFLNEYDQAVKAANGAYVNPLDIAKNIYDTMMESQYDGIITNTLDIIQSDTMKMFDGLFGSSETDSNKALSKFMKGEMTLIDANKLVQLLSDPDPTKQNQLFGTESGGLGTWMSMYNNGSSAEEVGLKVAYDVARSLGYNPPKMDENFKKNMEKFYSELPSNTARAQLSQAMLVAKWTVDAMKFSDKAIDPEIVNALGGSKVPMIIDNHIVIDVGGTPFVYDPGEGKASESFYYHKKGSGAAVTLTSNKEVTESKRIRFENSMKEKLVMDQYGIGQKYANYNFIKKTGDKVSVNLPALERQLNNIIEAKGPSLERISQDYISALNTQAMEWEDLTGAKKTLYSHVEYSVDTEALARAAEDGSILTTPLNSFITYTLKTEGEPKQKQRIDPWL